MKINIEYKNKNCTYPIFFKYIKNKHICVMYDINTKIFANDIISKIEKISSKVSRVEFQDAELIPSEDKCLMAQGIAIDCDYLLAVGSGTLNDMAKDISTRLNIPSGVLATAPSMDGYASKGSALMIGGKKITTEVETPHDILIDLDIICNAPKNMIAAGVGDILGKYTCLTDWKLSSLVTNENYHNEAAALMSKAVNECLNNIEGIIQYQAESISKLMDALITAGLSMAMAGNSRPASGSEHHISHFLEMDFVKRGEAVPLHGIKVGIGTLISLELYNYLLKEQVIFDKYQEVYELIKKLPEIEDVKNILLRLNCPIKMSKIGVRKEVMEEMIEKAYLVRDRFTILTLINKLYLTNKIKPIIMQKYW